MACVAVTVGVVLAAPVSANARTTTATGLLSTLRVRIEHNAGYDRSKFTHWIDADADGCDTRAEVLLAESVATVTKTPSCTVLTGRWHSAFDRKTWTNAGDVDIDHLVALAEAWGSGAKTWSSTQRMRYANDMGYVWSLNAMTDNLNAGKSDDDPSEWLPPANRCNYVVRWMNVKYRWRLTIDLSEKRAIKRLLRGRCEAVTVALPKRAPKDPGNDGGGTTCDASYPTICIPPPPPDLDCGDIPYRNFKVVAPDDHHLDGNGDGVGCET